MKQILFFLLLMLIPAFSFANSLSVLQDTTKHANSKRIVLNGNKIEAIQLDSICDKDNNAIRLELQIEPIFPTLITQKDNYVIKEYHLGNFNDRQNLQLILRIKCNPNSNELMDTEIYITSAIPQPTETTNIKIISEETEIVPWSTDKILVMSSIEVYCQLGDEINKNYHYENNWLIAL